MKILVVEDEFVSRKVIHKLLSPLGECEFAMNGQEALDAFIYANDEGSNYDLICLDINMPQLSGLDTLKKIREIEEKAGIGGLDGVKVIMVTGNDDTRSILGAFRAGCEAYVVKPFDKEKFLARIAELGVIPHQPQSTSETKT